MNNPRRSTSRRVRQNDTRSDPESQHSRRPRLSPPTSDSADSQLMDRSLLERHRGPPHRPRRVQLQNDTDASPFNVIEDAERPIRRQSFERRSSQSPPPTSRRVRWSDADSDQSQQYSRQPRLFSRTDSQPIRSRERHGRQQRHFSERAPPRTRRARESDFEHHKKSSLLGTALLLACFIWGYKRLRR